MAEYDSKEFFQAERRTTRGDRVRAMNDHDLAKMLARNCPPEMWVRHECPEDCRECWLAWVREEVSGARG